MICWQSGHRPQYRSCAANRTVQYLAQSQSSVFGGGTKTQVGWRLRSRDQTNSECCSDLVNISLQILCYPSLVWSLPSNLKVKTKKKKVFIAKSQATWSVLLFRRKKRLWWPVFGQKFASSATTKVYSRLGSTSSDLGGHGSKCHPPCIGVARIFDWGRPKPKITCNKVIRNFWKRNFLLDKDIVEWKIRSRGLVWHLTENFLKREGLKQKLQMKISKLGDLCKKTSLLKRITDGDLGMKSLVAGRFFEKKSYFNAFGSHFARVQNHLKELDY